MARRILTSIFASGLYDDPPTPGSIDTAPSDRTALQIAREGVVLLKNDRLLPISGGVSRLAVIGAHADKGVLSGGGSSQVVPRGGVATLEPAKHMRGAALLFDPSSPLEALRRQLPRAQVAYDDGGDPERAAEVAADAELVILFAEQWMTETTDAHDLTLPDRQDQLIEAVLRANPRTVVVLETGGPVLMPWLDRAPAVLEAWYPGQQGGQAIAEALCGAVNPSGRLPVTFPASEAQLPRAKVPGDPHGAPVGPVGRGGRYGTVFTADYNEAAAAGYKWFVRESERPLFPFGFGLSYTAFALRDLAVAVSGGTLQISANVRNVGERTGAAVPQFYLSGPLGADAPLRLVGWSRTELKPGEEQRVTATVDPRLLARFDEKTRHWRIRAGTYEVTAGFDVEHRDQSARAQVEQRDAPP
jgi:beta-glucosidase